MTFGDFEDEEDKLEPINSDSWTKLSLSYNLAGPKYSFEEYENKEVAWMCARFPSLRELEFKYDKSLSHKVLSSFVFEEQDEYSNYLKQIKVLSAKANWSMLKFYILYFLAIMTIIFSQDLTLSLIKNDPLNFRFFGVIVFQRSNSILIDMIHNRIWSYLVTYLR